MSTVKTRGPAFPLSTVNPYDRSVTTCDGMTMRDYFAAKAMLIYLQGPDAKVIKTHPDAIASWCYIMADAMLKAREA